MKNCVGQAVRGNDFFNRENEISDIWNKLNTGSHILLAAPRRVGKTSIMFHLQDNPEENYLVLYIDTESADNENEFWQKLFNALLEEEFVNKLKIYSNTLWKKFTNIKKLIAYNTNYNCKIRFNNLKIPDISNPFKV